MKDDSQEIAEHLIAEHGLDGAMEAVINGITEAHEEGYMYRLSVWRDVRRIPHRYDMSSICVSQ